MKKILFFAFVVLCVSCGKSGKSEELIKAEYQHKLDSVKLAMAQAELQDKDTPAKSTTENSTTGYTGKYNLASRPVYAVDSFSGISKMGENAGNIPADSHGINTKYEWCKAHGANFSVGLRHDHFTDGDGEDKYLVIKEDGMSTPYAMIYFGAGSTLGEVTIHTRGTNLYIEVIEHAYNEEHVYYHYNVASHSLEPSTHSAYVNY